MGAYSNSGSKDGRRNDDYRSPHRDDYRRDDSRNPHRHELHRRDDSRRDARQSGYKIPTGNRVRYREEVGVVSREPPNKKQRAHEFDFSQFGELQKETKQFYRYEQYPYGFNVKSHTLIAGQYAFMSEKWKNVSKNCARMRFADATNTSLEDVECDLVPSNYQPKIQEKMKGLFEQIIRLHPDDYVLCPCYVQGDLQLFITGALKWLTALLTAGKHEEAMVGAIREFFEEVKALLTIEPSPLDDLKVVEGRKIWYAISGTFSRSTATYPAVKNRDPIPNLPYKRDITDSDYKVCVLAHGTLDVMKEIIEDIKRRLDRKEGFLDNGSIGVVAVPIKKAYELAYGVKFEDKSEASATVSATA